MGGDGVMVELKDLFWDVLNGQNKEFTQPSTIA